ncbi:MAG: antibiotic biosynthesis monooxygenase [Gammaproteobacteria bacterium]|nr:antibiotic biosynthesis monooxygenase [Gammaproteobacteria bacterium]
MADLATTPPSAYYAVIFSSVRTGGDDGYSEAAKHMLALASKQPGLLGFETARHEIDPWKENTTHRQTQKRAKDWYKSFRVRVCRVEREYGF